MARCTMHDKRGYAAVRPADSLSQRCAAPRFGAPTHPRGAGPPSYAQGGVHRSRASRRMSAEFFEPEAADGTVHAQARSCCDDVVQQ